MWKSSLDLSRITIAEPVDPEPVVDALPSRASLGSEETEVLQELAQLERASREALLEVLSSDDPAFRGRAIRALYRSDPTRGLAELLIDCEVEPDVRTLLLVLLRELDHG